MKQSSLDKFLQFIYMQDDDQSPEEIRKGLVEKGVNMDYLDREIGKILASAKLELDKINAALKKGVVKE